MTVSENGYKLYIERDGLGQDLTPFLKNATHFRVMRYVYVCANMKWSWSNAKESNTAESSNNASLQLNTTAIGAGLL